MNTIAAFIEEFTTPDTAELLQRIAKHIVKIGDCWVWEGSRDSHGYGQIKVSGKLRNAHRVMLCIASHTPFDYKADACHKENCEAGRPCCNPSHLIWGSHSENLTARDRIQRRRKLHPMHTLPPRQWPASSTRAPEQPCIRIRETVVQVPEVVEEYMWACPLG
jgi:hypothetical protein